MLSEKFPIVGGIEKTEDAKGINERESRPNELNDPAVSGFVNQVEKYMRGESTSYFHHGTLVMDTKKAFGKAGITLELLEKWIPDWESKLAEATSERSKKPSGNERSMLNENILKTSQVPGGETSETKISSEKQEKLDNAVLLIEDGTRRQRVPYDFLEHLEKGDRVYIDRFFHSLGVNDSNAWTNRDLFLLWQGVVDLKEKKDTAYQKKVSEETAKMGKENDLMRAEREREYRKKRKISDKKIMERASAVAERLFEQQKLFRLDEFEDLLRPYFDQGNHKDYPEYSGEDLKTLCRFIRDIYSDLEREGKGKM